MKYFTEWMSKTDGHYYGDVHDSLQDAVRRQNELEASGVAQHCFVGPLCPTCGRSRHHDRRCGNENFHNPV